MGQTNLFGAWRQAVILLLLTEAHREQAVAGVHPGRKGIPAEVPI
jgi:hypothetical protein